MKRALSQIVLHLSALCTVLPLLLSPPGCSGQASAHPPPSVHDQSTPPDADAVTAQREFEAGAASTRSGQWEQAIPHLRAAQQAGGPAYAIEADLAICYLGLERYSQVVSVIEDLHARGDKTALSQNLLAQAYLGLNDQPKAWQAMQAAMAAAPNDEKLYGYLADASNDHHAFDLGLHAMDAGLQHLPESARLHYERGLFLAELDRIEDARPEFDRAAELAPDSYIGVLALVQKDLYDDRFRQAAARLVAFIHAGHRSYQSISLLGTVLMHAGATPGEPEFAQAQELLEESARANPEYSATQLALGKIYDMEGRYQEAIDHLEAARRLQPHNASIYTTLIHACQRTGNTARAAEARKQLARLLAERAGSTATVR